MRTQILKIRGNIEREHATLLRTARPWPQLISIFVLSAE